MNRTTILAATLGTILSLAGGAGLAQPARSVWDGIYTAEQADRGAAAYVQSCGQCHGVTLGGTGEAPGLTGGEFVSHYDQLTVGDLFDRIRTTMPQSAPATLARDQYADILAFLLKSNGFPAGSTALDKRSEVLATIALQAQKPTGASQAGN